MKVEHITMAGHGTTGTDGIDAGIHLRWSFNDKLGFPGCFKLFRRESITSNQYNFPIKTLPTGSIDIPNTFEVVQEPPFTFTVSSAVINNLPQHDVDIITQPVKAIQISGDLTILFSNAASRVELSFYIDQSTNFDITLLSNDTTYYPYTIKGTNPAGVKNISFDAPNATGIAFSGNNIKLSALAVWVRNSGDGWKRINDNCGCGLPVNTKGTPYINEVYNLVGKDLAMALCRLGARTVPDSPITTEQFLELKGMLLTMLDEGVKVPVGWTLFPNDENEDGSSFEFSKYDLLLSQSLQVYFAKIIGLYFTDTDILDNKYYDYKITAEWSKTNIRRLDNEITFDEYIVDQKFLPVTTLNRDVVLVNTSLSTIVDQPYDLYRTQLGLKISAQQFPTVIVFTKPVTEVQLMLINPDFANSTVVVEAYRNLYSAYVDRQELTVEKGLLRLRSLQIDSVKIYGSNYTISRIHYDFDPYPIGEQEYIVCGLKKQDQLPLTVPSGLIATCIPGGTSTDDAGVVTEKPYLAGLRWEMNEDENIDLISISPVLYHIQRKSGTTIELLTDESPLFVTPTTDTIDKDIPIGWPNERQFYTEPITENSSNNYQIAGIDLFGRQSAYTAFTTYELKNPKPPHPTDVEAKFLDYSCYNTADDNFSDVTLNDDDKNWLRTNKKNSIKVSWQWPENFQLQAPEVEGFNIYYKQGWLNTYTGIILSDAIETVLSKTSLNLTSQEVDKYAILETSPENIPVYKFQIKLDEYPPPPPPPIINLPRADRIFLPDNAFRLCWLTQGNKNYLILKNGTEQQPFLWALKLNGAPQKKKGFGISVTPGKQCFINYKNHENWTDTSVSKQVPKDLTPKKNPENTSQPIYKESYKAYITDPKFPNPLIAASDLNKIRYAQIGVNAFVGETFGSVSPASTIMAVYRAMPSAPAGFVIGGNIEALKATPSNVDGKSSFALRWAKGNGALKYQVYRALDETLFTLNNKNRQTRSNTVYNDFKTAHPEFNPADVDLIKQIPFETNATLISSHYTSLTPPQLQILASLPDNSTAFTRINDSVIDINDPLYNDKVTEIPDPVHGNTYVPDPAHVLLYNDSTLNGQSNNRYFYAIRSVDTNGLQSALSLSTLPVEIPKTTPPPAPVISSISGGENQVIVRWAKNPGANISGYLLYRTADRNDANDWRKMELIKNVTDEFTIAVNGTLPAKEFEFVDSDVTPRQTYYYGVIAVGLSDEGKWLRSRLSKAIAGKAFDQTLPQPPVWDATKSGWIYIDDKGVIYEWTDNISSAKNPVPAVRLVWENDIRVSSIMIGRMSVQSGFAIVVANWVSGDDDDGKKYFIDKTVSITEDYTYTGKSRSFADLKSITESILEIVHPVN